MKIQIGQKTIGDECEPYIVAEVGSNWRTLDDCLDAIRHAQVAGADAVKFQLYTQDALYGYSERYPDGFIDPLSGQLPIEWLSALKMECNRVGIEFLCSAFSPELIRAVDPFVVAHKVASAELTHLRMLEELAHIRKPVILSCGASGPYDIRMAIEVLRGVPLILLYCVAEYPARDVNLANIPALRSTFGTLVGYSDHTLDVATIPEKACNEYGACLLEKHFAVSMEIPSPDLGHSLLPSPFHDMVTAIRGRGRPAKLSHTPGERDMVLRHNRRLIATRDVKAGERLVECKNFGIYRSLKEDPRGMHPFSIEKVQGQRAKVDLRAGDGIGPQDIEP